MTTDVRAQLETHQATLLSRIAAAAKVADTSALLVLHDDLRRTVSLIERFRDLSTEVQTVLALPQAPAGVRSQLPPTPAIRSEAVAGRGHGIEIRAGFLARALAAGLRLVPHRGAIYATPMGRRIGIAVATERNPNRWFLGLGEGDFDAAVLLCAQTSGRVLDVCLPASFIANHIQQFSRSGGQIKFNLTRRDGHLLLKIPSRTPERVEHFVGAVAGLDPAAG